MWILGFFTIMAVWAERYLFPTLPIQTLPLLGAVAVAEGVVCTCTVLDVHGFPETNWFFMWVGRPQNIAGVPNAKSVLEGMVGNVFIDHYWIAYAAWLGTFAIFGVFAYLFNWPNETSHFKSPFILQGKVHTN